MDEPCALEVWVAETPTALLERARAAGLLLGTREDRLWVQLDSGQRCLAALAGVVLARAEELVPLLQPLASGPGSNLGA
jgi:hypothetical protein